MLARKLKPEEIWRAKLNMAVAFESEFDWEKERETSEPSPKIDFWGSFADDSDIPSASLIVNKYDMRFDGNIVKMGGIGGVATLPEARRGGAVRACFEASLRDMYESGFVMSTLYPFSTRFYRQFGYENGVGCKLWNLPVAKLDIPDVGGTVRQLFPWDDFSPLAEIYNAFYENCNLSTPREIFAKELTEKNQLSEKRYSFLWEDENGKPGAFLIGKRDGEVLDCRRNFGAPNGLFFKDIRALMGILRFVKTAYAANYTTLRFFLPEWLNIISIIPEANDIGCEFFLNGMVRAVNVEKLLQLCRCKGEGELIIEVADSILPENSDTFKLKFKEGEENRVTRTSEKPHISLDIGDLTTLICGIRTADELPLIPAVTVHTQRAEFEQVFYKKRNHISELF